MPNSTHLSSKPSFLQVYNWRWSITLSIWSGSQVFSCIKRARDEAECPDPGQVLAILPSFDRSFERSETALYVGPIGTTVKSKSTYTRRFPNIFPITWQTSHLEVITKDTTEVFFLRRSFRCRRSFKVENERWKGEESKVRRDAERDDSTGIGISDRCFSSLPCGRSRDTISLSLTLFVRDFETVHTACNCIPRQGVLAWRRLCCIIHRLRLVNEIRWNLFERLFLIYRLLSRPSFSSLN